MDFDIHEITNAWKTVAGFSQPNWREISRYIREHYPEDQVPNVTHEASLQWLHSLGKALGPEFRVGESKNFLILAAKSPEIAARVLQASERALVRVRSELGPLAWHWRNGKHVIVLFEDVGSYYRYLSYYYPDEGEFSQSLGTLLCQGYWHTAIAPTAEVLPVIVHELTHLSLARCKLPIWLEEGLVAEIEGRILGQTVNQLQAEDIDKQRKSWSRKTIQAFWSGEGFHSPDLAPLCYGLAGTLVHDLISEPNFLDFVRDSSRSDFGDAAARMHFGKDLGGIAQGFLGNGDWSPNRS
jgi:hypothetical protein